MKCGLLGRKLGHSYSPQIHKMLGSYTYELFEKEPQELEAFLKSADFAGINVTVPYKKTVIPYLDELTPRAQSLGAVNTIVRKNRKLIGHNTDYFGFETMVEQASVDVSGKKVLVLGSGGASNTAAAVLREKDANVVIISRSGENNYHNLHLNQDASIIVNTTPVGMYPQVGDSPLDLALFPKLEAVLDVIYNPARTKLLLDAEKRGLVTMNGLLMLVAQAKEAAEWFTGTPLPNSTVDPIVKSLERQMHNLILIGMPGCGKSTVGKLLAKKIGLTFVDADAKIEELAGKSIPQIFAEDGEEAFRTFETEVLSGLGKGSGQVIATGGGCVTRQRNYPHLHQNGVIFWLKRDLTLLPKEGRPLSMAGSAEAMYVARKPLYEAFADHIVDNHAAVEDTVSKILEIWEGTL